MSLSVSINNVAVLAAAPTPSPTTPRLAIAEPSVT